MTIRLRAPAWRFGGVPILASAAMPTVRNTGIPLGLSVPTSAFGYFGEGLTDTRPSEAGLMVPATPTSVPGMSTPDATGLAYLPNVAQDLVYDHIDFTNIRLVVGGSVKSVTFNKCRFRCTDSALQASFAAGNMMVQATSATMGITFADCNLDGSLPDSRLAIAHCLVCPSGNTSAGGVTFLRNNISGFSTLMDIGSYSNFNYQDNYCHDAVVDKHGDAASGYTDPANWAHVDGFQIGAANHVGSGVIRNNVFLAFSPTNQSASGPLQVGQMANQPNPTAQIDSFVFDGNYLDGGAYVCGANLATPIQVNSKFEFTNNKIGRHFAYDIDSSNSVHSLATLWTGNTYYDSGTAGNVGGMGSVGSQYEHAVTAGQAIP